MCSVLQGKLEKAEASLKVHKEHEDALARRCESLTAALEAHRLGESRARNDAKTVRTEMSACMQDYQEEIQEHIVNYDQLKQEFLLLQNKYDAMIEARYKPLGAKQWFEEELFGEEQLEQLEEEEEVQLEEELEEESRSGPSTPPRGLTMELPLPLKRRVSRTMSNSPSPVCVKRHRLSEEFRIHVLD